MSNRLSQGALRVGVLLSVCAAAGACAVTAGAATVVPTSLTACRGKLAPDSSGKALEEPNLLSYSFQCDGPITAYSIVVNQNGDHNEAIDDFNAAPAVLEGDDVTPSPTETVTCEGTLPSDGINCNTGALGAQLGPYNFVAGSVDPVAPYCKHLPSATAKGKPAKVGTLAVPTARVQLIVTDATGAQDGPFALRLDKACPKVPDAVPPSIALIQTRATGADALARRS